MQDKIFSYWGNDTYDTVSIIMQQEKQLKELEEKYPSIVTLLSKEIEDQRKFFNLLDEHYKTMDSLEREDNKKEDKLLKKIMENQNLGCTPKMPTPTKVFVTIEEMLQEEISKLEDSINNVAYKILMITGDVNGDILSKTGMDQLKDSDSEVGSAFTLKMFRVIEKLQALNTDLKNQMVVLDRMI